jgi:predicted hydrolase (HD superfamily)
VADGAGGGRSRMIGGMSVPTRAEAAALLSTLSPPPWHLRHSRAVAEVAAWLADRAVQHGTRLDRRLVEAAALLHDADKALPQDDPDRALAHGLGSGAWLTRHGHPELADVVASHPVTRLANGAWFTEWIGDASPEALLVAYADKRAGQQVQSMSDRFVHWRRRYPAAPAGARAGWTAATIDEVWERALVLERRVCELAGVLPDEVGRLRWTSASFAAARRQVARTRAAPKRVAPGWSRETTR